MSGCCPAGPYLTQRTPLPPPCHAGLASYLLQQVFLVIFVVRARIGTGIKAPTLYPRDSEIKALALTDKVRGGTAQRDREEKRRRLIARDSTGVAVR